MKKLFMYLSMMLCLIFAIPGCVQESAVVNDTNSEQTQIETKDASEKLEDGKSAEQQSQSLEDSEMSDLDTDDRAGDDTSAQEETSEQDAELTVEEDGFYTSRDEVALYIHTYEKLPGNFITKQEAEEPGWVSSEGNLDEVAPGKSIGGNRFGNYENTLPDGKYKECDINYHGGYRGDERIVYSEDGAIYYTDDHYETFIQLY